MATVPNPKGQKVTGRALVIFMVVAVVVLLVPLLRRWW
jgi:hypothetical protein